MEEPNNDIDTETLQAQIDLSMAYAQNLVASWLPPPSSSSALTQSSSRAAEAEAELQALLRRPPRLGVGAPLPETHAPAQTRLVQKLKGGKGRARNMMENGAPALATTATDSYEREEDEGEDGAEETRGASAVRKRPRVVDPFELGGKTKKKKMKKATAAAAVEVEAAETAEAVEGEEALPATDIVMEEAPRLESMVAAAVDATTSPSPKKRKKRKKKKKKEEAGVGVGLLSLSEGQEAQGPVVALGEREPPVGEPRSPRCGAEHSARSPLDERDGLWNRRERGRNRSGTPASSSSSHSVVVPPVGATVSPKPLPASPSILSVRQPPTSSVPSAHPAYSPPVLNLAGPPPIAPQEVEGSPPKKRRRKRKKKKQTGDQGGGKDLP